jgi:hypothetical protein
MAFFPVLSIRYKEEPTQQVISKRQKVEEKRTAITDLARAIVWSTVKFFNSVVNFLSGRPYNPDELPYDYSSNVSEETVVEDVPIDKKLARFELKETARYIVDKHKELLTNRTFPPASKRGQYPSTRTGFLAKSITLKQRSNELVYDIGYKSMRGPTGNPAEYSQILVDWGRKSIPDTTRALSPIYSKNNYLIEVRYDGSSF